jgi:hypothetical protein
MIDYTTLNSIQVRISIDDLNSSLVQSIVYVKDEFDCVAELNFSSVFIESDMNNIFSLITSIQSGTINFSNSLFEILYGGNQNDICQMLTSVGEILNTLAEQNL